MVANILPKDPLTRPWGWAKGQNSTFTEHGHLAYQAKGNGECNNMEQIFCRYTYPRPLGWGQRSKYIF